MNIKIRKAKDLLPSNWEIVVGDVRWGRLVRENMSTFRIQQEGSNKILRHGDTVAYGSPMTLDAQSLYEKRHRPIDGEIMAFEARAFDLVLTLIKTGKLTDPDTARKDRAAEEEAQAQLVTERKAREREKFASRARELLDEIGAPVSERTVEILVKSFREVQSW